MRDQAGEDGSQEAVGSECSDAWVSRGSEEEEEVKRTADTEKV